MLGFLPTVLLVLLQAYAADAKSVVHENAPSHLPNGWKHLGSAKDTAKLSLSIALKQPGLEELRKRLDQISDPSHEAYGAHLSQDEVRQYRQVSVSAVDSVLSWLQSNDVEEFAVQDAWVNFNATVAEVNTLLSCSMSRYQVTGTPDVLYRALHYSLPEELLDSVDYVYPVTQFMAKRGTRNPSVPSPIVRRSDFKSLTPRAGTYFRGPIQIQNYKSLIRMKYSDAFKLHIR